VSGPGNEGDFRDFQGSLRKLGFKDQGFQGSSDMLRDDGELTLESLKEKRAVMRKQNQAFCKTALTSTP
jgi:hypothetical protein